MKYNTIVTRGFIGGGYNARLLNQIIYVYLFTFKSNFRIRSLVKFKNPLCVTLISNKTHKVTERIKNIIP